MRFQSQKECLFTAGWDQTIWRWVKAKPTFWSSSIPCWGAACLCAGLPQGLRPHLPLGLPPSWSFAFLPPRRLPQVSQARVCPRTFLLWSQCRAPGDQPVSPFILTEVRLSDCLQWFQNYRREMKIQPRLHCTFPPYPATLALLVSWPLRGCGFISHSTPPPCLM